MALFLPVFKSILIQMDTQIFLLF